MIRAVSAYRCMMTAQTAEVLAADASGNPMMTVGKYGKGQIFYINLAIERMAVAEMPGCFHGEDVNPVYLLYREAMERAGIRRAVTKLLPGVGITEHPLDAHRTVCVAVNYEPEEAVCPLEVSGTVKEVWNGAWENGTLRIGGNDGAVFVVEH